MKRFIIGSIIGAVTGFLHYRFIGCSSGICMLSSNPWLSTLGGALVGLMIVAIISDR